MTFSIILLAISLLVVFIYPLHSVLDQKDMEIQGLRQDIFKLENALERIQKRQSSDYFSASIASVNGIVAAYFQNIKYKAFRNKVSKTLGAEDGDYAVLEQMVNANEKGIMQKVREQMSWLAEDDVLLLCFLYAGLSYQTIRLLTDETVSNLYSRKSRMMSMIEKSEIPDKQLFLNKLKIR